MKMKKYLFLSLLLISSFSQAQFFQHAYGGSTGEEGIRVFMAPDSGYYLISDSGYFKSIIVTKTDRFGDSLWSKFIKVPPSYYSDFNSNVCQTNDMGYAVVFSSSDTSSLVPQDTTFILKYDSSWNIQYSFSFTDTNFKHPTQIIQTSDSCYLVTGIGGKDNFGFPFYIYATKFSSSGIVLWDTLMLPNLNCGPYPVQIIETTDHHYLIAAYQGYCDNSAGDLKFIKIDAAGNIIWIKTYYSSFYGGIHPIIESLSGFFISANTAQHNGDNPICTILKFDTAGNFLGEKVFMTNNSISFNSFTRSPFGGYYLTGTLGVFNQQIIVTRIDEAVDSLSSFTFSDTSYILKGNYITQFDNGNLAIVGTLALSQSYLIVCDSSGNIPLGVHSIVQNNIHDIYIFPNPTSVTFTLSYNSQTPILNSQLKIYDVLGQEVYTQAITNPNQTTINVSQLSNGVYFYQLNNNTETYRGKFVKE